MVRARDGDAVTRKRRSMATKVRRLTLSINHAAIIAQARTISHRAMLSR
jgi:hypothetical protein